MVQQAADRGSDATPKASVFDVTPEWFDRVIVLSVHGDLDALTASRLTTEIEAALSKVPSAIVVDLSGVDFLASAGITVLVSGHERVTPTTRFAVVADGSGTSRPLKLMALDTILTLLPTLDDALNIAQH